MSEQPPPTPDRRPATEIDLERLADKVYRLMLEEARLERVRGDPATRRRTR